MFRLKFSSGSESFFNDLFRAFTGIKSIQPKKIFLVQFFSDHVLVDPILLHEINCVSLDATVEVRSAAQQRTKTE